MRRAPDAGAMKTNRGRGGRARPEGERVASPTKSRGGVRRSRSGAFLLCCFLLGEALGSRAEAMRLNSHMLLFGELKVPRMPDILSGISPDAELHRGEAEGRSDALSPSLVNQATMIATSALEELQYATATGALVSVHLDILANSAWFQHQEYLQNSKRYSFLVPWPSFDGQGIGGSSEVHVWVDSVLLIPISEVIEYVKQSNATLAEQLPTQLCRSGHLVASLPREHIKLKHSFHADHVIDLRPANWNAVQCLEFQTTSSPSRRFHYHEYVEVGVMGVTSAFVNGSAHPMLLLSFATVLCLCGVTLVVLELTKRSPRASLPTEDITEESDQRVEDNPLQWERNISSGRLYKARTP